MNDGCRALLIAIVAFELIFAVYSFYRIYPCISRTFFHEKLLPKRGSGLSTETLEKTSREDT